MLRLPKTLIRQLRGGAMDGTEYAMTATRENYEMSYILGNFQEGEDRDNTMVYLYSDKHIDGDKEFQFFDFYKAMPEVEARAKLKN